MSEPVILVPLDGSEQALAALPVAKVIGEIERMALHILQSASVSRQARSCAIDSRTGLRFSTASPSTAALELRRRKFCRSRGR